MNTQSRDVNIYNSILQCIVVVDLSIQSSAEIQCNYRDTEHVTYIMMHVVTTKLLYNIS